MRTILAAVLAVFTCGLTLTAQDKKPDDKKPEEKKAELKKFDSKDGKYSATFPGEPKTSTTKAQDVEVHIAMVEKGKGGFAVIFSDMPADKVKGAPAAKLLENGEKGLVDNFKAKITKSGETKFKSGEKEYPARDILAEKDELHLRITIILVDNRLFQVFVVGPKDMVTGKEADDFFKSFELGK